ncbi:MAG: helix-turn-helix transcriptional regulator [Moraxellaceae bacterium]|nr:helix-turn-helix transcriptional regulator [Pseudobdellovibrionaceae bacterium]
MKKNKVTKSGKDFFNKILKDPTTRMLFEEEKSKTEIAYAVRSARLRADLTQAQLAKKIGSTQSVIARLESGTDKRTPSIPLLSKIASACGASFEFGFTFSKAS